VVTGSCTTEEYNFSVRRVRNDDERARATDAVCDDDPLTWDFYCTEWDHDGGACEGLPGLDSKGNPYPNDCPSGVVDCDGVASRARPSTGGIQHQREQSHSAHPTLKVTTDAPSSV
jgi:hypothetical protein